MDNFFKKYRQLKISSAKARIITAVVLVMLISSFILSGALPFMLMMLCINQLALMEYERLVQMHGFNLQKFAIQIAAFILLVIAYLLGKQVLQLSVLSLLPLFIPFLLSFELFRNKKYPIENIALSILGLMWISVPLCLFLLISYLPLRSGSYYPEIVLGYFIILWLSDSGAYLVGKTIGKQKLFERISPNKTWEGSVGGLACAWIAGFADFLFLHHFQLNQWLLLSLIIYITGAFGDFAKSMLKRSVNVKDSGNILPGHGGIIDRFDTLIGSAPFAFLYLFYYV